MQQIIFQFQPSKFIYQIEQTYSKSVTNICVISRLRWRPKRTSHIRYGIHWLTLMIFTMAPQIRSGAHFAPKHAETKMELHIKRARWHRIYAFPPQHISNKPILHTSISMGVQHSFPFAGCWNIYLKKKSINIAVVYSYFPLEKTHIWKCITHPHSKSHIL